VKKVVRDYATGKPQCRACPACRLAKDFPAARSGGKYRLAIHDGAEHPDFLDPVRVCFMRVGATGMPLNRVFAIDIEACPECGGNLRVIACIEDPPLIRQILSHVRARGRS
jgi:hypothetical protein